MKKKFSAIKSIAIIIMILAASSFSISASSQFGDFTLLAGGTKPETQKVEQTIDGIVISGDGSYSPVLQASGVIYTKPVNPSNVTVEYIINTIPTLNSLIGGQWSQDRDSWYTVSLMDKATYWTNANTDVKSISIAVSPIKDDKAYVHGFTTYGEGFGQHNYLATIPCKVGDRMTINIKWVNRTITASVNGINIPLLDANDMLIGIPVIMTDKCYVAVACNTGKNTAKMTLEKINGISMKAEAQATSTASSSTSVKTSSTASSIIKVSETLSKTSSTLSESTSEISLAVSSTDKSTLDSSIEGSKSVSSKGDETNDKSTPVILYILIGVAIVAVSGGVIFFIKRNK